MINDYYAVAIGAATREEIDKITELVFKINEILEEKKKRHIETFLKEECLHPELIRKG